MLRTKRILVAGDLMVDTYILGEAARLSPEAPVPVVRVVQEEHRPGGAGNVMLNLLSLGMQVTALGRIGKELSDQVLQSDLHREGVSTAALFYDEGFYTPRKTRILASGQQIVRVDDEVTPPLSPSVEQEICATLPTLLEGVDMVAISDYAKGFLTVTLLQTLISHARARCIPIIVDPKGSDFRRYRGATLLKPNLGEAILASGLMATTPLEEVAQRLFEIAEVENVIITRAKEGLSLFSRNPHLRRQDLPTHALAIKDVTGAGDTVLAIITAAVANQMNLTEAAILANYGAGLAVQHMGCARISHKDLRLRPIRAVGE